MPSLEKPLARIGGGIAASMVRAQRRRGFLTTRLALIADHDQADAIVDIDAGLDAYLSWCDKLRLTAFITTPAGAGDEADRWEEFANQIHVKLDAVELYCHDQEERRG